MRHFRIIYNTRPHQYSNHCFIWKSAARGISHEAKMKSRRRWNFPKLGSLGEERNLPPQMVLIEKDPQGHMWMRRRPKIYKQKLRATQNAFASIWRIPSFVWDRCKIHVSLGNIFGLSGKMGCDPSKKPSCLFLAQNRTMAKTSRSNISKSRQCDTL